MASFFGISGNSSLFSGLYGTDSNSNSGNSSALSDYSMIRSGVYKKLLNAYYGKNMKEEVEDSEEVKESRTNLSKVKASSDSLEKAAKELQSADVTNREALSGKVESFVKAYNETIESAAEVDTKSVLHKTLWMIGNTNASSNVLREAGITIGKDNKLTVDSEKLKNADHSTLELLFKETTSFVGKTASKSSDITSLVTNELKRTSSKNTYSKSGDYSSVNTNKLYDSLF